MGARREQLGTAARNLPGTLPQQASAVRSPPQRAQIINTVAGRLPPSAGRPTHSKGLVSHSLLRSDRLDRPSGSCGLAPSYGNFLKSGRKPEKSCHRFRIRESYYMERRFSVPQNSNRCANCVSGCWHAHRRKPHAAFGSERMGSRDLTTRRLYTIGDPTQEPAPNLTRATHAGTESDTNCEHSVNGRERREGEQGSCTESRRT